MLTKAKKIAFASLSIFLVGLLLLGSSGISLNRMMCLFTGSTHYALFQVEGCCPSSDNNDAYQFLAKCCDFTQSSLSLEVFETSTSKVSTNLLAAFSTVFALPGDTRLIDITSERIFASSDLPPPIGVAKRLALTQVYRI